MKSEWRQIQNDFFSVQIASEGAEMRSLYSKKWQRELLWQRIDHIWNRSAPVLFPFVGQLKDDEYQWRNDVFKMPRHGFARDLTFTCIENSSHEVRYHLIATQETLSMYPWHFELFLHYALEGKRLTISHVVKNMDSSDMYFSIGAHPAFQTPEPQAYEIRFEKEEEAYYRPTGGLIDWSIPHALSDDKIKVEKSLFDDDALIFKNLSSSYVDLIHRPKRETIRVRAQTPYWGIWGKAGNPFICVEPWQGIADSISHNKCIVEKEGMKVLKAQESFTFSYSIELCSASTP